MQLNSIIFPAPKVSYSGESKNVMWISGEEPSNNQTKTFTRQFQNYKVKAKIYGNNNSNSNINWQNGTDKENNNPLQYQNNSMQNLEKQQLIKSKKAIPCLYLPYAKGSDSILIYFHGNAEDLGYSYDFVDILRKNLEVNILCVEYPGYGVYEGDPNSDQILEDSEIVFDFLTNSLGINSQKIFIFGRSIGSGPATHLASKRRPGALMLMCPYTSIREIAKFLAGNLASYLIADRFKNIEKIDKVRCPTFFVHGQKDKLIPYQHSIDLMSKCKGITYINLSENMTHNDFKVMDDVVNPIAKFMRNCDLIPKTGDRPGKININPIIFRKPKQEESQNLKEINNQHNCLQVNNSKNSYNFNTNK